MLSPSPVLRTRPQLHVADVIARHAAARPRAPALVSHDASLDWSSLAFIVGRIGAALADCGLTHEHRVALVGGSPAEMAVAMTAVSAVAPCMTLPGGMKHHELALLLGTAGIGTIIDLDGRHDSKDATFGVIRLALSLARRTCDASGSVGTTAPSIDAALLLPTSGTSAASKVVPISQARMLHGARTVAAALQLGTLDRCLSLLPMFHVSGQFIALLSSWMAGGPALCVDDAARPDVLASARALAPTWLCAVPTILSRLAREQAAEARALELEFIHTGAAALAVDEQRLIEEVFGAPVIQSYGMTETIMISCNPRHPTRRKLGSVGLPRQDTRIIDSDGRPLPAGATGEIAVAGGSVMPDYLGSDTARFANGYLCTGDVGHIDEDGHLIISGRTKEMINRGGEKISPLEVDSVLARHPAVSAALCFAIAHPVLGEDIAAVVVLEAGGRVDEAELRAFVASQLRPHKVPRRILFTAALPTNATGKPVRTGLAERFARELSAGANLEPAGALGERLASAPRGGRAGLIQHWLRAELAERLAANDVSPRASFVSLGLDSVGFVELRGRLSFALGFELPQTALFEHGSCDRLARHIVSELRTLSAPPLAAETSPSRPLLRTETNWLRTVEESGSAVLVEGLVVRGPLDRRLLTAALHDLVRAQPMLRVTVSGRGKHREFVPAVLPVQELVHEVEAAMLHELAEGLAHRRDFTPGAPMFEAHLVRVVDRPGTYAICLRANHVIWDGSNGLLATWLRAYATRLSGGVPQLTQHEPYLPLDTLVEGSTSGRLHLAARARFVRDVLTWDMLPVGAGHDALRTRHMYDHLDPERTQRLEQVASERGLSVAALLTGALIHTVRAHMPGVGRRRLTLLTMIDVRGHVSPTVPVGAAGCYASAITSSVVARSDLTADAAAVSYHRGVTEAYAAGLATDLFALQSRLFTLGLDFPALLGRGARSSTLGVSAVSTYASVERTHGPLEVVDMLAATTAHGLGPCFMLYPIKFLGGTRVVMHHPEPLIAAPMADAVFAQFMQTVRAWCA